jgi:hypothetical protein
LNRVKRRFNSAQVVVGIKVKLSVLTK